MGQLGNWLSQGWWSCDVILLSSPLLWKGQLNLRFSIYFLLISGLWTKFIHLVSKDFRKIYFVASNGRDGNWNSEDYITNFWRGSEGVVKTLTTTMRRIGARYPGCVNTMLEVFKPVMMRLSIKSGFKFKNEVGVAWSISNLGAGRWRELTERPKKKPIEVGVSPTFKSPNWRFLV